MKEILPHVIDPHARMSNIFGDPKLGSTRQDSGLQSLGTPILLSILRLSWLLLLSV